MTRSHAHRIATVVLPVVAGLTIALTGLLVDPSPARGEAVEATHCFTGTFTAISGSQELTSASHWAHHGIVRSSNKKFENAATYCGGANRGTGPTRQGYVLCRMVDADGDIIMIGDQYATLKYSLKFLEGTGKWKDVTGGVQVEEIGRSPKPAMPNSYHACVQWKGTFEVRR